MTCSVGRLAGGGVPRRPRLYVQLQNKGAKFRGHLVYLVETDRDDLLSDIKVFFEDEEEADRFFSA